ncbi:MAG: succinate dehydrogenase, hydrophobic membrane anchor protein [Proteobacteria bacterium]|nr:succinate dehydrogenase, hydrophobic membrane anchor protein [Pseudomonadota bacterium]MYJ95195.1 succinate dehydrogenase, hydrophobic membrane anchor protein [Pseudomonadota bacterium]
MRLVSPLNRVLGLGSAKTGVEHWWAQRLTAVALIPLGLWFAMALAMQEELNYAAVVALIQAPFNSVMLILALFALSYHSHLGVQMVIEDYVHTPSVKVFSLVAAFFAHIAVAVAGIFAVLKVAFGTPA